ncbi:hypothetical protein KEM55_008200 [Ascosphaera atra]|nr:hypothetical protein KEM55_008200 [Ascosphaera atra]
MAMQDRLSFLKYMVVNKLTVLDAADQAGAVKGLMNFMIGKKLARTKTFLSCINAAVLESLQRGAAMALGVSKDTGGNPGTIKWAEFFHKYQKGLLKTRDDHDLAWAMAEQRAVDYGVLLADTLPGIERPTNRMLRFVKLSWLYRSIMMYRRTIIWFMRLSFAFTNPSVAFASEEIINWLTDVSHAESVEFLGEVSWALSALAFAEAEKNDPLGDAEVALKLITGLWEGFKMRPLENKDSFSLSSAD